MSLYQDWITLAQTERNPEEQKSFWDGYFATEKENYKKILAGQKIITGSLTSLAAQFDMELIYLMGFLDGINGSIQNELDLDGLSEESEITLEVDFEKLYYNMLDAKADWLYTLPEWDPVLSEARRREITKEFRHSKVYVNDNITGRNDPCPCGSGKKYKKCCGMN